MTSVSANPEGMSPGNGSAFSLTKTILHAEDDENYATLFECSFQQTGFDHALHHVSDGGEAIAYLKGDGKYADRIKFPFPCLVLADLKMPRVSGFDLLEWIRRQSSCPYLPVVVLTCSDEFKDVQRAYELGANSFLVKPIQVRDLTETIKMLNGYWLRYNVLESQIRLRK